MDSLIRLVILLAVLVGGVGALRPAAAQSDDLPRFEPAECMVPVPADREIACGYLLVPEDRSRPDSPTIRLAVAILKSWKESPAPDPVLYLDGGPGGSPIVFLTDWQSSSIRLSRDLILLDQRGTGFSEPSLDCPEMDALVLGLLDKAYPPETVAALQAEAAFRCRDRLLAAGVSLAAYTSAASAADVADLRVALGYDAWNLYGISYGTRLALTTMRDHPQGIRSVVLDSAYPPAVNAYVEMVPNGVRAFDLLFAGCAADARCNAVFPSLDVTFADLVDRLNADPPLITVEHPVSGQAHDLLLTGDMLIQTLFGALYVTEIIPYLPYLIHQADGGAYTLIGSIALAIFTQGESLSEGMLYSVECHEEFPFNSTDDLLATAALYPDLAAYVLAQPDYLICDTWGSGTASAIENEPVYSDIPTLVLAGEYDPVTPPAWGQIAAETLSQSYLFEFPGMGHGVTYGSGGCPMTIMLAFLNDPSIAPNAACLGRMGPPAFLAP